jgi:hypothetical protein
MSASCASPQIMADSMGLRPGPDIGQHAGVTGTYARALVARITGMIAVIEPDVEIRFFAPLLAMTAFCGVIASEAQQSRWFRPGIECQIRTTRSIRGNKAAGSAR